MSTTPIRLYAMALSPFVHKVAAILDAKKIPYTPIFVHPLKKTELAFSRRKLVPVIDDAGTIIEDSTEIALYLEDRVADPQLVPDDRAARRAVLATERWLDDTFFARFYVPVMFGIPANRERAIHSILDTTEFTSLERRVLPHIGPIKLRHTIAQAQADLYRLSQILDDFETRLGSGPYLAEQAQPSLADLTAFGPLSVITDLGFEGAESLRERGSIRDWMERVRPLTSPGTRIYRG